MRVVPKKHDYDKQFLRFIPPPFLLSMNLVPVYIWVGTTKILERNRILKNTRVERDH